MRIPLFALTTCFVTNAAHAQPFNWQWMMHDTAAVGGPDVMGFATDAFGNSYVAGQFYGEIAFGDLPALTSAGQGDVYVAKFNNQGLPLWAVSGGGQNFDAPYGLTLDGNGNIYITGYLQSSSATFGSHTLTTLGNIDIFVARLDASDGNFIWAERYGSNDTQTGQLEWGRAITCDAAGDVYVTGCFRSELAVAGVPTLQGCSQYFNSFLMKLAPDGSGIWSRRPDCSRHWALGASEGETITVGQDGMLYAGFRGRGDTLFFEGDTAINQNISGQAFDVVLVKYDLDGEPQWVRDIGGYGYDEAKALQADADGNLYAAIHRESDYSHLGIPGVAVAGNLGEYRNVILKFDAAGTLLWGTRMGNSTYNHDIAAMRLEAPDKLLVGGWHQGNFEIGGVTPNPGITGTYGFFLARFNADAVLTDLTAQRHNFPRGIRGIDTDAGGNIYVAGYFHDSLALGPLPAVQLGTQSSQAMFVARSGDFPTALGHEVQRSDAMAYPVPSDGRCTVQHAQPFDGLRIVDAIGRVVLEERFALAQLHLFTLRTPGTYTAVVLHEGRVVGRARVLVER